MWKRFKEWMQSPTLRGLESAAIAVAALVAAISFWYQEVRVPARQPAGLVVAPELEEISRWNDSVLVRARINLSNRSQSKVFVPALYYRAWGVNVRARDSTETGLTLSARDSMPEAYARFSVQELTQIVAARRLMPRRDAWFQPGAETRFEEFFVVPVCDYRLLQLQVDYFFTKNVKRLKHVNWSAPDGNLQPTYLLDPFFGREKPMNNEVWAHRDWKRRHGAGSGWTYTVLPIRRDSTSAASCSTRRGSVETPKG